VLESPHFGSTLGEDFQVPSSSNAVTGLLEAWSHGDKAALDKLTPLVHEELRRLAHHYMSGERAGHTLQTTALVNEAYVRLVDQTDVHWQSRAHFFAVAAQVMRHILIDYARTRARQKRGGEVQHVSLDEAQTMTASRAAELLALDEALHELAKVDERRSKVVEFRYFGGLSIEETAAVLKLNPVTVSRDWRWARAWLFRALQPAGI
jgi:RNA polymerase sigma factor (TIGR02999 family)